jgi:hypothetical protein
MKTDAVPAAPTIPPSFAFSTTPKTVNRFNLNNMKMTIWHRFRMTDL